MATDTLADRMTTEGELTKQVLQDVLENYAAPHEPFRTLSVFDDRTGNYLLIDEGWEGYRRIHRIWLHIELRSGKFWIHEDTTEEGVANRLVAAGIARERIVLAFQDKARREVGDFAIA